MRLNRVLLLAAAINLMIFAIIFTISCSAGEDGKNGRNGEYNCSVDPNEEGDKYIVTCGGEEIGEFVGSAEGLQGDPGADGEPGADGKTGPYCWLGTKDAKGSYPILCGSDGQGAVSGSLDACSNVESANTIEIQCGSTAISLCSGKAFNPAENTCIGGSIKNNHEKIAAYLAYCGTKPYYADKEYCGFASKADADKGAKSILKVCGTAGTPNESGWLNQYCQFKNPKAKGEVKVAELCGDPTKPASYLVKINEGSFKGEYCGWASATAAFPSVLKGSCSVDLSVSDENAVYSGPHEEYFNAGYCEYNRDGKVQFNEKICETNKHPNSSKWNGEYCGVTSGGADKVYTGICDDGNGPNTESFNSGFCQYDRKEFKTTKVAAFCDGDVANGKGSGKPNENTWKGEYCGCANKDCSKQKLYSGLCDDDDGPNIGEQNKGYCRANSEGVTVLETGTCGSSGKINAGEWKGEYCGYASEESSENDKVYEGGCDDGNGPNSDGFASGYCRAGRDGKTEKTSEFCGASGKPNDGEWKGEYCGFANAASSANDKVWTGACDDGMGPNRDAFESGYCRIGSESDSLSIFTNEYCGEGGKLNEGKWKAEYCFADEKVAACTGGLIANEGKKSTDPLSVRCTFANPPGCSADRPDLCDEEECLALATEEIEYEFDGICKEKE